MNIKTPPTSDIVKIVLIIAVTILAVFIVSIEGDLSDGFVTVLATVVAGVLGISVNSEKADSED